MIANTSASDITTLRAVSASSGAARPNRQSFEFLILGSSLAASVSAAFSAAAVRFTVAGLSPDLSRLSRHRRNSLAVSSATVLEARAAGRCTRHRAALLASPFRMRRSDSYAARASLTVASLPASVVSLAFGVCASSRALAWASQNVCVRPVAASSKSSAVPNAFVQFPPAPSAQRTTQVPAVWLRRYPRATPGAIRTNTGFLAGGNLSLAVRLSSRDDRAGRGTLPPVSRPVSRQWV